MRPLLIAAGVAMVMIGAVWTAQGLGYLDGSSMTDVQAWAIIGPLVAGLGVGLVLVAARRQP